MSEDLLRGELHKLLRTADIAEYSGEGVGRRVHQQVGDWHLRDAPEKVAARRKALENANATHRQRWLNHPVTQHQREPLSKEIQRFFTEYYKKLRTEVARHENVSGTVVPSYLKGRRQITTYFCRDGVLIVHMLADDPAAEKDTYSFIGAARRVRDVAAVYNSPRLGGRRANPLTKHPDGADLEPFCYPDSPLSSKWTRMDFASLNNLYIWRYEKDARQQAKAYTDHWLSSRISNTLAVNASPPKRATFSDNNA